MTKVYAVMVARNEADRYLEPCLRRLCKWVDQIFLYDDRSTDETPDLAEMYAHVRVRPPDTPGFLDDESAFRSAAYAAFADHLSPSSDDWVLSLDADEFLMGNPEDFRSTLMASEYRRTLNGPRKQAFSLKVLEAFNEKMDVRTDGFWGSVCNPRLFRWDGSTQVPEGIMGCGSLPAGFMKNTSPLEHPQILHMGYARQEDRVARYVRYTGIRGHNPRHIKSILGRPHLVGLSSLGLEYEED